MKRLSRIFICFIIMLSIGIIGFSEISLAQSSPSGAAIFGKSSSTTQTLSERSLQEAGWFRDLQQWLVEQQKIYYQKISAMTRDFAKQDSLQALWSLVLFSFFYGIVHAAGPGHGKVLITTYVMTQPSERKRSLIVSFIAAMMQASVAIILVYGALFILSQTTRVLTDMSRHAEGLSYLMMASVGVYLIFKTLYPRLKGLIRRQKKLDHPHDHSHHHHHDHDHHGNHGHHDHECCGGHHAVQVSETMGWREMGSLVLAMGLRPCSGALFILVFAYSLQAHLAGILSSYAMGIGTFLTVGVIALTAHSLRQIFLRHKSDQAAGQRSLLRKILSLLGRSLAFIIPLLGGVVITLTAVILLQGLYSGL